MDTFSQFWGQPCAGILALESEQAHRRKGLAKYLLGNVLRHLRERSFRLAEAHADPADLASQALLRRFDFPQVETGHSYRKALAT